MNLVISSAISILLCVALTGFSEANGNVESKRSQESSKPSRKHLKPFTSEAELNRFLKDIVKKRRGVGYGSGSGSSGFSAALTSPTPMASTAMVTASSGRGAESITNTQHAGVDEGGIVKMHGDYLSSCGGGVCSPSRSQEIR